RGGGQRGVVGVDERGERVAKAAAVGGAGHHGDREGGGGAAGEVGVVGGPPDGQQHGGHDRRGGGGGERAPGDERGGGAGGCAAAFQRVAFALRGHRGPQIAEARRDHAQGDDAGHVAHRRGDRGGVAAAAEHRREDHQEQHRQGQGEELPLAGA